MRLAEGDGVEVGGRWCMERQKDAKKVARIYCIYNRRNGTETYRAGI